MNRKINFTFQVNLNKRLEVTSSVSKNIFRCPFTLELRKELLLDLYQGLEIRQNVAGRQCSGQS